MALEIVFYLSGSIILSIILRLAGYFVHWDQMMDTFDTETTAVKTSGIHRSDVLRQTFPIFKIFWISFNEIPGVFHISFPKHVTHSMKRIWMKLKVYC